MHHMTKKQTLALLKTARDASERDFVMILLAYTYGLRATEVCELKTTNFSGGFITVARQKGSDKTSQRLFGSDNPLLDVKTAVTEWLKSVPEGLHLFRMTRQHFNKLFKRHALAAGIPAHLAHPHCAKHSIAYELVDKISIHELQRFLGHKSLQSTGRYLVTTQEKACDAVERAMSGGQASQAVAL